MKKQLSPLRATPIPAGGDPGPTPGPSPQEVEMAARMRTVLHRLIKVLRKHTRNNALLSLTERSTMALLYQHQELPPSELAQIEKVTTQSMSQVINHLFELNFISKSPSGDDKRKVLLSLTPSGRAYIDQSRLEKQEWLAQALHEKTSAEEKEVLARAMQVLAKLVDE
jgi:DNA-binding MarR family transcriptional regulator